MPHLGKTLAIGMAGPAVGYGDMPAGDLCHLYQWKYIVAGAGNDERDRWSYPFYKGAHGMQVKLVLMNIRGAAVERML